MARSKYSQRVPGGVGWIVLGATADQLTDLLGPRPLLLEDLILDYGHRPAIERGVLADEAVAVLERSLPPQDLAGRGSVISTVWCTASHCVFMAVVCRRWRRYVRR